MWKLLVGMLLMQGMLWAQVEASEKDGKALFKKCTACHGSSGEKRALGTSIVINTLTKEDIVTSIKGYQNGTYGRSMQPLMKGQVIGLRDKEIEKIATYVSKMNPDKKSLPVTTMKEQEIGLEDEEIEMNTSYVSKINPDKKSSAPLVFVSRKETVVQLKVKAKRYLDGITKVKFFVKHDMDTPKQARRHKIEALYVTKIILKENNTIVYELDSTSYLARNPVFKFTYRSLGSKKLQLIVLNNRGEQFETEVLIKQSKENSASGLGKPPIIRTELMQNHPAIYAYLGKVSLTPIDRITLTSPDVASNGGAVPVAIRSDIKAKRVILFATEEEDKTQRVAEWKIHPQSIIDLQAKIKMDMIDGEGVISVVIEGEDGRFYLTEVHTVVALGGGEV